MKIIYFYTEDWETKYIAEKLPNANIVFYKGRIQDNPDLKDAEAEGLVVFVTSPVGAEEMERFPNLKFIATRSTGFDHIDIAEAHKRNITVMNVPDYGANTVAEHAFALLLTLSRKVYDAYEQVRETGSFSQNGLRGFDLAGKTIGIVGVGHIGRHAALIARGFGMRVLGFDMHTDDLFAKEAGLSYLPFEELLKQSDIITLHVPYNTHTRHLINTENITLLKKGAYLINTSRGAVVETEAIVEALTTGTLAGAGLDVLEEEGTTMHDDHTVLLFEEHPSAKALQTVLANHYLIDHPRVIITPHIAFNTQEALTRILDTTIENITCFTNNTPQNTI